MLRTPGKAFDASPPAANAQGLDLINGEIGH
jgi:hypothetical protein